MLIFRNSVTINAKFINLFEGDKVSAIGANGRHYSGTVPAQTQMRWRRDIIKDADLSSNYFRITKVNGLPYE